MSAKPGTYQPAFTAAAQLLWSAWTGHRLYEHLVTIRPCAEGTVRLWYLGSDKAPPWALDAIAILARQRAALLLGLAPTVEDEAAARHKTYRQPRPRKAGFMLVCERDGPGSIPRDGRRRKAT